MTDAILPLVPVWGVWLVAAVTFLSCLALPVPASLVMLAAGAFSAAGDLSLATAAGAAFAGAVAGDHLGYALGRLGGGALDRAMARAPQRRAALDRARDALHARSGMAVFLTRWLLSPLGPYVNVAAGAARLPLARFTLPDLLGEGVWVAGYTGLGFAFAGQIELLGDVLGNASGALAAGAVAVVLALWLMRRLRTAPEG